MLISLLSSYKLILHVDHPPNALLLLQSIPSSMMELQVFTAQEVGKEKFYSGHWDKRVKVIILPKTISSTQLNTIAGHLT